MGRDLDRDLGRDLERLERRLDSFDPADRKQSLLSLVAMVEQARLALPRLSTDVNLHCHTFFSYNAYGYSPTRFAWLSRRKGLAVAEIVDFDVLDGLEEFLEAGALLRLKACCGLETRVFVPEFADHVINSPGEPGISYHMGVGFPSADLAPPLQSFLSRLRRTSSQRNRDLLARVNAYLDPVVLDYDADVLPLTPSGNATERHICLAYARKARHVLPADAELAAFWSRKLCLDAGELDIPDGTRLQQLIRAKTMKQDGVGYVQPDAGSFPRLEEANRFILAAGGIPTHTWLDGTSDGERRIEELLRVEMDSGVSAVNVIPDRSYTPGARDVKLDNLYQVVNIAERLRLIVVAGTEMNSPGQKFVDDLDSDELSPLAPIFLKGAHIVYAHSVLQRSSGLGYTSEWARNHFPDRESRSGFFEALGVRLRPDTEDCLAGLGPEAAPEAVLKRTAA